jgi:predicted nucleotidyltransferase
MTRNWPGSRVDLAGAARMVPPMRLRETEAAAIREEVARLDPAARVWLFGSRVDDRARGGDIDLLVRSDRMGFADKVLLKVRVLERIGAQQLDLVLAPASRPAAEWIASVASGAHEL